MTQKEIHEAFLALNEIGYNTRENFECCDTCAWAELENRGADSKAVFYHAQQNERVIAGLEPIYLSWRGNATEIIAELGVFFAVNWNGSESQKIQIKSKNFQTTEVTK
jgi:hypothetical protein